MGGFEWRLSMVFPLLGGAKKKLLQTIHLKKKKKETTHTYKIHVTQPSVASLFWVKQGQAVKEKDCFPGYLAVTQRQASSRCWKCHGVKAE